MNEKKIALMTELKELLEKHGTNDVLQMLADASENLMGIAEPGDEEFATEAASRLNWARLQVHDLEVITGGTLASSLEVLIECEAA